jgi:hypothetical protein
LFVGRGLLPISRRSDRRGFRRGAFGAARQGWCGNVVGGGGNKASGWKRYFRSLPLIAGTQIRAGYVEELDYLLFSSHENPSRKNKTA